MSKGRVKPKTEMVAVAEVLPSDIPTSLEAPPLAFEPPHKKLARLNSEEIEVTNAIRDLKKERHEKNLAAQKQRLAIPSSLITHYNTRQAELAGRLLAIQTEKADINRELRARKAERRHGNGSKASKPKEGPLKTHQKFDQYFYLAAVNELHPDLVAKIVATAKAMLGDAISNGVED